MGPEPFTISVPDDVLGDLRARLRNTRWPENAPGEPWSQGTDLAYLKGLVEEWAERYDWRAHEALLNRYSHFTAEISGTRVHFIHERSGRPALMLTHGWPSCFTELLPLVDRLSADYDLVVPSMPGYGFSARPPEVGIDAAYTAGLWLDLMDLLGYKRFGAIGGDFGAAVTTHLALRAPERLTGILLTTSEMSPVLGPDAAPLTDRERAYVDHLAQWDATERGYSSIQSTRPQTLGYGLSDSPAGLAAWLIEKWRAWSDSGGDVDSRIGTEFLLTLLTIYWCTNSITSSMRDYFDARWHGTHLTGADRVSVPTAISVFANEFIPEGEPPREWYERLYDIRQWTVSPRGGHFAAIEEPDALARDIRAHFA
ncbi:epoxide hydrolase family protein [Microbacterium sp. NPDC019599]|uniref:epoxide hydrolase family protein n=1 Tax=Microbacterium sp. NPDC019599 TaxID=3154690 RepID=UPI003411212A